MICAAADEARLALGAVRDNPVISACMSACSLLPDWIYKPSPWPSLGVWLDVWLLMNMQVHVCEMCHQLHRFFWV